MSNVEPPPESKQLIATGDSFQADQPTKWDFLEQQTVTLTLNLDDILKDGNQSLLNNCEFSVSGRMAFACKNCKTSQMASALEDFNVKDRSSNPENQEIVESINKSKTTLCEASDLLLKCADKLEEMRAALNDPSEYKEKVKKNADSEIKKTTRTVIDMLNKLSGNTGTVNSNNDNDDKPQGDNEDSDGSEKSFRGPEGGDTYEEPKHLPNYPPKDPSKKNEDATGGFNPTKSANEQQSENTEPQLVERTESQTTNTDNEHSTERSQVPPLPASTQDSEKQEPVETDSKDVTNVNTSVALPLVPDVKNESGNSEPNPLASGVDKKEGDFEETPDAGSGSDSQPTSELPQEHSAPAESAIGKAGSENKADESRSGVAPVPDPVEKQLSRKEKKKLEWKAKQEAERTSKKHSAPAELVIEQIPEDNKADNSGDKNVKVEEDESLISMDVMLLQYFMAMSDVRAKKLEPRRVQLSGLLGEISVFYRSDDFETYAAIDPNDLFKVALGPKWIEERGVASDICRQLVHFYKTPAKRYATDIIAYLHHNLGISTNPDDKKVLSMKQLFVKFNEELFSWITSQWLKRAIRYGKHRLVEIEDKSSVYAWRDKPADYRENSNVDNRINYYKTHTETFEDRLISSCYKYLTSHHQDLKKYHDILDFDLDYICAITPVPNKVKELLFFVNIFDFDIILLKKLFYEKFADDMDNNLPNQEAPVLPKDTGEASLVPEKTSPHPDTLPETENEVDTTDKEEILENKEDGPKEIVPKKTYLSPICFPILFSTMKFIRERNGKLENFKFDPCLEQIYMFHTTKEWRDNYKNNPQFFEILFTKLFGSLEELRNKEDMEYRFCNLVALNMRKRALGSYVEEMFAQMDYTYKDTLKTFKGDGDMVTECFLKAFTLMVYTACEEWIISQFETSLNDYIKYHDARKTNLLNRSKDTAKYSWRPRPPSYQKALQARIDIHVEQVNSAECNVSRIIVTFYRYLMKLFKPNDYLNDALEFIFTRSEETMKSAELKFFISLFGLKKWSPWYSNHMLELLK